MIKTYSEVIKLPTFQERFNYLRLGQGVGDVCFGWRRYLNQALYHSPEWLSFRNEIMIRDNGCDLACEEYQIFEPITIHHINSITYDDILSRAFCIFDPENVICTKDRTHKAIHYGGSFLQLDLPRVRTPNDTCPWKRLE